MPRTILIVDDIRSNRVILKNILGDEYSILEAAHGQEAIAVMEQNSQIISAVLLDLGMPVMDGFDVLSYMQQTEALSQLPVIVTTGQTDSDSEEKALRLGAKDYISKPYKSAIIKQRIWNTIKLRETAATVNALQRDRLTGLLSRESFFERVTEQVAAHEPGYYILAGFDVDSFKVINDQYGTQKGDEALRHIASVFLKGFGANGGFCCRVMADNFAVLYPTAFAETEEIEDIRARACQVPGLAAPVTFSIGRYIVDDRTLSPSAMLDRATLAADSVKGRYDKKIALYDESMRKYLLDEQRIVNEMGPALSNRQFEIWFQPQYNHTTGALIGAEALVRWRHPEHGLIPPVAFIPVFEKNGFIYELDKYMWEETCRHLRKWTDEGRNPLPVSVNISRYDIFRPDLLSVLTGLVVRYGIPTDLLRLEITESAFAKSTEQIVKIVKDLIDCGFTIEIDDFGSGYSSLNTLKSVPAQVLKLDMRFLEDDGGSDRGGNILESIVRMAKWLGMSVIAEGVEDIRQADFLKSIGCNYVQGYLYARPMPASDYEALCRGIGKEERLLTVETVENLNNSTFWNPKSMDTLIFNSYVGGACILESHNGKIELLRANDKYAKTFGPDVSLEDVYRDHTMDYMDEANRDILRANIQKAIETGTEVTCETVAVGLYGIDRPVYIRSSAQLIARTGDRYLLYGQVINMTELREAERKQRESSERLSVIMSDVGCGITASVLTGDRSEFLFCNDKYYEILGFTKEQYHTEVDNVYALIHPEDRAWVRQVSIGAYRSKKPIEIEYRVISRDKTERWVRASLSSTHFTGVDGNVQLCIFTDIDAEKHAAQELLDNLPCGAALYEYDGKQLSPTHLNQRYWELVDRSPVGYGDISVLGAVHPEDRAVIGSALEKAIREHTDVECDVRVRYGKKGYRPFHIVGRIVPRGNGTYSIYASYTPITDEEMTIRDMLPIALNAMMNSQTDYSFVKDKNYKYVCCSRAVYEAAGLSSEAEIVGKTDFEVFDTAIAERYRSADCKIMETGVSVLDCEDTLPITDGVERYSKTSKFPLKDSQGNIVGIYGYGRDVTEDRAMKSRLELLTNNIPGGIAIYEGRPEKPNELRLTYFSDGFCRLFGFTRAEYQARADENPLGQVNPEDLAQLYGQIQQLMTDATPMDCTYRAKANGNGYKWINLKAVMGEPHGENLTVNAVLFDVTMRQEALEKLRMSEEMNRLAIRHSRNVVCRYDVVMRQLAVSSKVNDRFGVGHLLDDVPYGQVHSGNISPETADAYIAFYERILRGEKDGEAVFQRKSTDGYRWLDAQFSTIFSSDGDPVSAVISYADVTEDLEKEAAYKKWQQSFQNKKPESYALFRCNLSKKTTFDTVEGSLLRLRFPAGAFDFDKRTEEYVATCVYPADGARFSAFLSADALLAGYYQGKRVFTLEYREKSRKNDFRWLRLTVDLVEHPHAADVEAYLLFENIDEAKRAELITRERAETDPLTGVLNRMVFMERVNDMLKNGKTGAQYALLMLDIDGFKQVNDVFGHGAGDQALIELSESLSSALRRGDLVGRLGGDEFAVFLSDIPGDGIASNKAKQLLALTRKAFSHEVEISGSIGIAISPRDGRDFDVLYKKADAALYYVKGSGKDNYAFYHADMSDEHLLPEPDRIDPTRPLTRSKKRRMLIVDDSRIDHALLSNIFADDFIVEKAKDGVSALIRLRHYGSAISVVLLDLLMPGMDGFAVLDKMQQSTELRGIPVIVVSGDESRDSSLRAIRAGASDFINKPVDADVLRIRVQSAISKAENERLRAKNSLLEYQSSEVARYKTVLERSGTVVIEHDWINGTFSYDPAMSEHIAGTFDERKLWHILLTDLVADTETVKKMQELVHAVAAERKKTDASLLVQLKTPSGAKHWFRMNVYKLTNEFGLAGKIYLAFSDLSTPPAAS